MLCFSREEGGRGVLESLPIETLRYPEIGVRVTGSAIFSFIIFAMT